MPYTAKPQRPARERQKSQRTIRHCGHESPRGKRRDPTRPFNVRIGDARPLPAATDHIDDAYAVRLITSPEGGEPNQQAGQRPHDELGKIKPFTRPTRHSRRITRPRAFDPVNPRVDNGRRRRRQTLECAAIAADRGDDGIKTAQARDDLRNRGLRLRNHHRS